MIRHFLRRDFVTYRVFWFILVAVTAASIPFLIRSAADRPLFVLGYLYFFFAVGPLGGIVGVTWRSQHVMSRNYLLSLPVSRRKMYRVLQVRAYVFWFPFLLLCAAAPFFSPSIFRFLIYLRFSYVEYALASFVGVFWFINTGITMQLVTEKITGLLDLRQRFLAWAGLISSYVAEIVLILLPLGFMRRLGLSPLVFIGVVAVLAWGHYWFARRLWLGAKA